MGTLDNSRHPHLHVPALGETGKYTALSCCGGKTKPVLTTATNIALPQSKILTSALPKTIQDAITITQKLEIQYLWVDSLCILQDSKEDWLRESSKMADYYGDASVTIQALGAEDSTVGCFNPRTASMLPPAKLRCRFPGGIVGHAFIRSDSPVVGVESLERRARAVQERLFSPRIVAFGSRQDVLGVRDYVSSRRIRID